MDFDVVHFKDECGLMEELQLPHTSDQWRLFSDSSKVSMKAVSLHNGGGEDTFQYPLRMQFARKKPKPTIKV